MLFAGLVLSSITARGDLRSFNHLKAAPKDSTEMVKRVEVLNGRTFPEPRSNKLRSNHVYLVYQPSLKRWIFRMTDREGRLTEPPEALAPDSIVAGSAVGGETNKNYLLTAKSQWLVSNLPARKVVWVVQPLPDPRVYVPLEETRPSPRRSPAKNGSSR